MMALCWRSVPSREQCEALKRGFNVWLTDVKNYYSKRLSLWLCSIWDTFISRSRSDLHPHEFLEFSLFRCMSRRIFQRPYPRFLSIEFNGHVFPLKVQYLAANTAQRTDDKDRIIKVNEYPSRDPGDSSQFPKGAIPVNFLLKGD